MRRNFWGDILSVGEEFSISLPPSDWGRLDLMRFSQGRETADGLARPFKSAAQKRLGAPCRRLWPPHGKWAHFGEKMR